MEKLIFNGIPMQTQSLLTILAQKIFQNVFLRQSPRISDLVLLQFAYLLFQKVETEIKFFQKRRAEIFDLT